MKAPPLGPSGEDITWPHQVDPGAEECLVPEKSNVKRQTLNVGPQPGMARVDRLHKYNAYNTLCALHASALPPMPGRETRQRVSVRPQQPSGTVFSCSFTDGPIGPENSLSWPSTRACRCYGQQPWSLLSAVVLTLPWKASAGTSVCSVVVSLAPRAFARGQERVLAFGL